MVYYKHELTVVQYFCKQKLKYCDTLVKYMENNELDFVAIGMNMKNIRKQRGITQEQLADMTGLSKVHISNMENAYTKVSLTAIVRIASVLKTSVDQILGRCDAPRDYTVEIGEIMDGCDDSKARVMIETLRTMRSELDKI